MKAKPLLLFGAVMAMVFSMAVAQKPFNYKGHTYYDPDHAKVAITGELKIDKDESGQVRYTLSEHKGKKIEYSNKGTLLGRPRIAQEDVVFTFADAKLSLETGANIGNRRLQYWRYNEQADEWQPDTEADNGEEGYERSKYMDIVLVLDNSTSLGENDFNKLKENARYFVQRLYDASNHSGTVRVGVIGFSTINRTKIKDIVPLNESNFQSILSFINDFEMANGTTLYYHLNYAVDMLKRSAKDLRADNYSGSYIVAFTDGVDNQSSDHERDLMDAESYFEYLKPRMRNTSEGVIVDGKKYSIGSWLVSMKGNDVYTDKLANDARRHFDQLFDEVNPIGNISEMRAAFERIVNGLIKRNTFLQLYVSTGFKGRVGWTLEEAPVKVPTKKPKTWFGISLEGGRCEGNYNLTYIDGFGYKDIDSYSNFGGINFDMDFYISNWLAIGGHFNLNFGNEYRKVPKVTMSGTQTHYVASYKNRGLFVGCMIGPEIKITFPKNNAILLSGGYCLAGNIESVYLMFGYKTKKSFYLTAKYLTEYTGFAVGMGLSWGGKRPQEEND